MRIAIIGQAAFGATVYEQLREAGHEIVGVFTPPEKRRPDPLAEAARADGVTLVQPARWQRKGVVDEEVFAQYTATNPELNVMAFVTQIIPMRVLDYPSQKTIQYHPSLLPKHRGRSAINHAIVQGDSETGLTIFWVDEGIDTGPILLQKRIPIGENETLNSLYRDHLFPLGVSALVEAVALVAAGNPPRIEQNEDEATYEGPWEKEIAEIDWNQPAAQVHNLIRGSDRQPGAWTTVNGAVVRLYGSTLAVAPSGAPGSVAAVGESGVTIRCGDGAVQIESARPEGEDRVGAAEWATAAGVDESTVCGA
jgi:methionyl-tRNA formyltransferase